MANVFEILGRALESETSDLIIHWFQATNLSTTDTELAAIFDDITAKKFRKARTALDIYLFDKTTSAAGRLASAAIDIQTGDLKAIIEYLTPVYRRQPSHTLILYILGHCHERLGHESQAVAFYQDCLKFKNYLQFPRQRLAAIALKKGSLPDSIAEHESLLQEYPDDVSTLISLGQLHTAQKDYPRAVHAYNKAILMHPDNLYSDPDEIDILLNNQYPEQALEAIDRMLSDQPGRADLMLKKADALNLLDERDQSLQLYQASVGDSPDFLEASIKLASHYLRLGSEQQAAEQFSRAVEINDRMVSAYTGLALARYLCGEHQMAADTLSLAAGLNGNTASIFTQMAKLQFHIEYSHTAYALSDFDDISILDTIIESHQRAIAADPANAADLYAFGILLQAVSRNSKALECFSRCVELNPQLDRARNKLALSQYDTGNTKAALETLTAWPWPEPDFLTLHYDIALLYCDKVRFASSMLNLEKRLTENFAATNTTVDISQALHNLGLLDPAVTACENLTRLARQSLGPAR